MSAAAETPERFPLELDSFSEPPVRDASELPRLLREVLPELAYVAGQLLGERVPMTARERVGHGLLCDIMHLGEGAADLLEGHKPEWKPVRSAERYLRAGGEYLAEAERDCGGVSSGTVLRVLRVTGGAVFAKERSEDDGEGAR